MQKNRKASNASYLKDKVYHLTLTLLSDGSCVVKPFLNAQGDLSVVNSVCREKEVRHSEYSIEETTKSTESSTNVSEKKSCFIECNNTPESGLLPTQAGLPKVIIKYRDLASRILDQRFKNNFKCCDISCDIS